MTSRNNNSNNNEIIEIIGGNLTVQTKIFCLIDLLLTIKLNSNITPCNDALITK